MTNKTNDAQPSSDEIADYGSHCVEVQAEIQREIELQARQWREATSQADRLSAMRRALRALEHMLTCDVSEDAKDLFMQITFGLRILEMGQSAPQFSPAEINKAGNYTMNEWLIQAYITHLYKIFVKTYGSQEKAEKSVEAIFRSLKIPLPVVTISNLVKNFLSPGKAKDNPAKAWARDIYYRLLVPVSAGHTITKENADAYCLELMNRMNGIYCITSSASQVELPRHPR